MSRHITSSVRPTRRSFLAGAGAGIGTAAPPAAQSAGNAKRGAAPAPTSAAGEPTAETALRWWSELPNKWTPVGWKDHLFRFNVLFNGTIVAQLDLNRRTARWKGEGVQLSFIPSAAGRFGGFPQYDDGRVVQSWKETAAPVLCSDWAMDGILMRQEVFAHVLGGQEISNGTEPLFVWIRLSIAGGVPGLPHERQYGFAIRLNAPHVGRSMEMRNNLTYRAEQAPYPRALESEAGYDSASGWRLLESDGRVRLAVAPGQRCRVTFQPQQPAERDSLLYVQIDVEPGAHADLLLPILPADRASLDQELALGYDGALAEANRYWSRRPATAVVFETPEDLVNHAAPRSLRLAAVTAERDPNTGDYSLLSGSWTYADVWATPNAMTLIFLLDNFGYHAAVAKHLALFRRHQGTVGPPGRGFQPHPGYLATPPSLTAINWLSDHGAILWAMAEHALLTGDLEFTRDFSPAILKGCEFVRDARRMDGHGGMAGILPPAVATDRKTEIQAVWSDGWNYKGLVTAVRLLERIRHPRAGEFAAEARSYREAFGQALRAKAAGMPEWTDTAGRKHRLVPTSLYGERSDEVRHAFYLDTGPLFLVFSGLLEAEDDLMRSTLEWFRKGPPAKAYRYDSNCWQVPSLVHEMSSCEPCYSWNVFHSHQAGDRARFLEGMYSLLSGALSRQTGTMCETRGGITGLTPCLPAFFLLRLAVADDQFRPGELHLLRFAPLAWLRTNRDSRFENLPTEFGPVSLQVRLGSGGKEMQLAYRPRFRSAPRRVTLHVPPVTGLGRVLLNGKDLGWNG